MEIVPVIDLKGGQVVHARAGRRDSYRPIRSRLAGDSTPLTVVHGLRALHPFDRLYVADLDAIAGRGGHDAVLDALREAFPDLALWVDNGLSGVGACRAWLDRGGVAFQRAPSTPDGGNCSLYLRNLTQINSYKRP